MVRHSRSGVVTHILFAKIEEASAIATVLRQAFFEYEPQYTRAAFAATTPTARQIEDRWREGPVWVAVQKEDLVGTVAAVPKSSGFYVRSMAVLPAARGQRIAGHLLKAVERFAGDHQFKRLFLSTTPFLDDAIRFYEHFGFQRSEDGPHDLCGTPLFTMVKVLPSTAAYVNEGGDQKND
jgi:GNAT superfamily N-acetyltransferase